MPRAPRPEVFPAIRTALRLYRISAYVTGIMLLLLVGEMVVKYGFHYELYAFGNFGALAFVPWDPSGRLHLATGLDLSTGILIAHGWLYVVYLFCDFRLWSLMRWPFMKFVQIALGGVIPFLSFIVEAIMQREVHTFLSEHAADAPAPVGVARG